MPSAFEKGHRRELLILDTGPIRELVLFHAVEYFGFERLRSELHFIESPESYSRCGEFIASFRKKTTSASVVAELHYWIRATERTGQERLWNRVYEEFREMGMDEQLVNLLKMDVGLVARFGPVDVSLLEIAKRQASLSPLVLTVDNELWRECWRAELPVQNLRELALGEQ
jgi:hypothetical protein